MITTILFDLDGTIIDTNELIVQSFLHSLEGNSLEPLTREHIIPNMGQPLNEQMMHYTGREDVEDIITKYRAFNIAQHDALVQEFPHVGTVLAKLCESGLKVGIVTSKIRKTTLMGLKLCGLESYISTIVTIEDVEKAKPDPEGIFRALRELGSEPGEAIMVGDSHYDIQAAQNAGVGAVGVSWSWKGRSYLERWKPDWIIEDIRELYPIAGLMVDSIEKNR